MENKTYDTVERLRKFIDYKSISVRGFSKNVGISHCLVGRIKSIGSDKLEKILRAYPDINPEWLLTGKGSMFRLVHSEDSTKHAQILEEPQAEYGKPQEAKSAACGACEEKERIIQMYQNQIEDLKVNMERLISEKSEVIKMKDQMLEMQAEKIAELEDFKKMQEQQVFKQKRA